MNREELLKIAKPILFNTNMTIAILDDRKTVTRKVVKPQLPENIIRIEKIDPIGYLSFQTTDRLLDGWGNRKAPYEVGDILYVRETFNDIETNSILYAADKDFIDYGCKEVDGIFIPGKGNKSAIMVLPNMEDD